MKKGFLLLVCLSLALSGCSGNQPSNLHEHNIGDTNEVEDTLYAESPKAIAETTEEAAEIDPIYDINTYDIAEIGPFYNGYARFKLKRSLSLEVDGCNYTNGLYGIVDSCGTIIVPPIYLGMQEDVSSIILCEYSLDSGNETYKTYMNFLNNTNIFTPDDTMSAYGAVSEGLFWIETVDKSLSGNSYTMTYYNTDGEKVFSIDNSIASGQGTFQYHRVDPYDNDYNASNFDQWGHAVIETVGDETPCIIDRNGNILINTVDPYAFYGNIILKNLVNTDSGVKYVDFDTMKTREIAISSINDVDECSICGNNYYYDNDYQRFLFSATTEDAGVILDFKNYSGFEGADINSVIISEEGYLTFTLRSKDGVLFYAIVDSNGNITMQPTTKIIPVSEFKEGLCVAYSSDNSLYGYIDPNGNWVLGQSYSEATDFHEGLASVNKSAVIDMNGTVQFTYN